MSVPRLLRLLFALAAAAPGAAWAVDAAKLAELRSASAEAAAVLQAQARGQVTSTYARGLTATVRRDLEKLAHDPELGPQARLVLAALDGRNIGALTALRSQLAARERADGRAG